jgi:hypothetical protein
MSVRRLFRRMGSSRGNRPAGASIFGGNSDHQVEVGHYVDAAERVIAHLAQVTRGTPSGLLYLRELQDFTACTYDRFAAQLIAERGYSARQVAHMAIDSGYQNRRENSREKHRTPTVSLRAGPRLVCARP